MNCYPWNIADELNGHLKVQETLLTVLISLVKAPCFFFFEIIINGINLSNLLVVQLDREDQVIQLSPTQKQSLWTYIWLIII